MSKAEWTETHIGGSQLQKKKRKNKFLGGSTEEPTTSKAEWTETVFETLHT